MKTQLFQSNKIVTVLKYEDETVQNLIKESSILITDYSSVFFDFAYLKKPLVYYQFDEDSFNDTHYDKGYFDYRKDGFGDVCNKEEEVIASLFRIKQEGFDVPKRYLQRTNIFFPSNDRNNCSRIFLAIKKLGEKNEN